MGFYAYLITDRCYGAAAPAAFAVKLEAIFRKHLPEYALYRDKENPDYPRFAALFVDVCHAYNVRAMLHRDIDLAIQLGAEGVHLASGQFDRIAPAKAAALYTVLSAHTPVEIMHAAAEGADAVTYSPIFYSPGKGDPLGLEALQNAAALEGINVIALGGIVTAEQIEAVKAAGAAGFASIRYFTD